jgi:hypothetical protein
MHDHVGSLHSFEHLIEHGHLHEQPVESFALHDAARAIKDFVGDRGVAPYR